MATQLQIGESLTHDTGRRVTVLGTEWPVLHTPLQNASELAQIREAKARELVTGAAYLRMVAADGSGFATEHRWDAQTKMRIAFDLVGAL